MKKRVWAIVCLTLFITAQTLTNIKVMASTVDSFGQELLDYMTLESMSIALTEGAQLDWADLDLGDAALSAEEKARRMLSYYREKAWGYAGMGLYGIMDMMSDYSPIEAQTAAIGLSMGSGLTNSTINDLSTQISNNALGMSNDDYIMAMNNPTIAYWNRYNTLYLNKYLDNMLYEEVDIDPEPEPVPPAEYVNILNNMNAHQCVENSQAYFWFWDAPTYNPANGVNYATLTPCTDYTWIMNNGRTWQSYSYQSGPAVASSIVTINITSNNGVYTYAVSGTGEYNGGYMGMQFTNYMYSSYGARPYSGSNTNVSLNYNFTYTGTLTECLNHINSYFKNVNIFVDGVCYAYVGGGAVSATGWNVSIPDAVTDTGTDDGKIVAAPIFWAVDENTGVNVDEWQVNLTGMLQTIIDKIDAGNTTLSMQDLVDSGAIEGTDGVAIGIGTGVVAGTKSLADAIAAAKAGDVAVPGNPAITLDAVAADAVPGLPSIPAMPAGMPGWGGVTVLARIVNFTNQSLPTELIVTFWGVVFGAVILGIIKVLHK